MRKHLGLIALVIGSLCVLSVLAYRTPKVQQTLVESRHETKEVKAVTHPPNVQTEQKQPEEDPDILTYAQSLAELILSEKKVLDFLSGSLSQNKKAVLIETYNERKGRYTSKVWGSILLHLISDSDEWPELANRAADSLLLANADGQLDSEILDLMNSLPHEEIVKRCALSFALVNRSSIEAALQQAGNREEIEILSGKEANLLSQDEKMERFSSSLEEYRRVLYLDSFLRNAKTEEELLNGVRKGFQDVAISNEEKPRFILAASESSIPGKSRVLFDYWTNLLPRSKELKDYLSILNIAVQKAAYSESDARPAQAIFQKLLAEKGLKPSDTEDPRIDLSIAMVNACSDPLIVKKLCKDLTSLSQQLRSKLIAEGFAEYLSPSQ